MISQPEGRQPPDTRVRMVASSFRDDPAGLSIRMYKAVPGRLATDQPTSAPPSPPSHWLTLTNATITPHRLHVALALAERAMTWLSEAVIEAAKPRNTLISVFQDFMQHFFFFLILHAKI